MTICENCERLQKLVSPREDVVFTSLFKKVEPVSYYKDAKNWGINSIVVSVLVQPRFVWIEAYGTDPSDREISRMSHTLAAIGWKRTKRNGVTLYAMPITDFQKVYK